jgi:type IV pilus assembly protein PilC
VFASRLSLTSCATLCRSLGTMLHSGVSLLNALKVIEKQQRSATAQAAVRQIAQDVRKGTDLATAFREHGRYFPELLVDMIAVAEQTGKLPEVLTGLADHYENLVRLRRTFLGAIAWPVIQLLAAIFIVAGLILVLGWIAQSQQGQERFDPLGFGLHGESGALIWLGYCFGTIGAVFLIYQFLVHGFRQAKAVHTLLLSVPVVGHCMRSFAVARFSWAYALTQQAGMDIQPSLEASLKATNNGAFAAATPQVVAAVMAGEEFTDAIESTGLFPRQFLEMVRVGESSGTVPETLEHLSPQFEEQARRALTGLTIALGWVIWSLVAAMIIFLIFRVFGFYIDMINRAASGQL